MAKSKVQIFLLITLMFFCSCANPQVKRFKNSFSDFSKALKEGYNGISEGEIVKIEQGMKVILTSGNIRITCISQKVSYDQKIYPADVIHDINLPCILKFDSPDYKRNLFYKEHENSSMVSILMGYTEEKAAGIVEFRRSNRIRISKKGQDYYLSTQQYYDDSI